MKRRWAVILLCLIFIATAVFSGYKIFEILHEYRVGEDTYDEMRQFIAVPAATAPEQTEAHGDERNDVETVPAETEAPVIYPEVDFATLRSINEDVTAWVYIEDTNINYPVVQGDDNSRYISRMIDGSYNGAGSIFMDYRNAPDFTDRHTVLYGHNMKNGSMFADIRNYRDQEYYDAHPTGLIMTPEKNFRFEIVAGYVASLADPAWQLEFSSEEEALEWLQDAMARSGFAGSTVPELGDRVITLSTCSYEFADARFVLVGVLKD